MKDWLGPLSEPLGFLWLVLVLWMLRRLWRKEWGRACSTGLLVVVLTLVGNNQLTSELLATLERPYAGRTADELIQADAVVMLGGTVSLSRHDCFGFQFNDAADRLVTAVDLARRGKGRVLILGGGARGAGGAMKHEGDLLLRLLTAWNVTSLPVLVLEGCRTTHDEALATQRVLIEQGWRRVILVTSASHMRRSEAAFRKLGIEIECYASDFRGLAALEEARPMTIVPTVGALQTLSLYTREVLGWQLYRLRGRL